METRETGRLATQVDAVIEQIRARLPAEQAEGVCAFASRFFAQVAPEDLEDLMARGLVDQLRAALPTD